MINSVTGTISLSLTAGPMHTVKAEAGQQEEQPDIMQQRLCQQETARQLTHINTMQTET